jgi:hypothetical protein
VPEINIRLSAMTACGKASLIRGTLELLKFLLVFIRNNF